MKLAFETGLAVVTALGLLVPAVRAAEPAAEKPAAEKAAPEKAAPSTIDEAAAELREHHRHHNNGGLTKFVAMGLDTLGVADEAKRAEVDKLQAELNAHMAPSREAEKALLDILADGVAAGALDKTKVDAAATKLREA